jgi:hypothetical protein
MLEWNENIFTLRIINMTMEETPAVTFDESFMYQEAI